MPRWTQTTDERFDAKWQPCPETGCWIWYGGTADNGYGHFWHDGRMVLAHRFAYERWIGPVPDGLELDHLCRTPACVNPDHLEAVTHQENCRRGEGGSHHARKTHCPQGHEYTEGNTYVGPRGDRQCRVCVRDHSRAYKARKKAVV